MTTDEYGARLHRVEADLKALKDHSIAEQSQTYQKVLQILTALSCKYDRVLDSLTKLQENHQTPSPNQVSNTDSSGVFTKVVGIDFPLFDGMDPTSWIYRAEQYFEFYNTLPHERVPLASFNLENDAIQWYLSMRRSRGNVTWEDFTQAICTRIGPTEFEDFAGTLAKLRQDSLPLTEYQTKFEKLANCTVGLSESFLVSCFVQGLNDELRYDVQMFRPKSLTSAIGLTRLQDEKLIRKKRRRYTRRNIALADETFKYRVKRRLQEDVLITIIISIVFVSLIIYQLITKSG